MTTPKIIKTKETPSVDSFKLEDHQEEPDAEFPVNTDADTPDFIPPVKPEKAKPKAQVKKPAAKPKPIAKPFKPVTSVRESENGKVTNIVNERTITESHG